MIDMINILKFELNNEKIFMGNEIAINNARLDFNKNAIKDSLIINEICYEHNGEVLILKLNMNKCTNTNLNYLLKETKSFIDNCSVFIKEIFLFYGFSLQIL